MESCFLKSSRISQIRLFSHQSLQFWLSQPDMQRQARDRMISEEKADHSALSWWWHSHNRSRQSKWLQTTISDLDKKTKLILSIIEDDGVSFAKRAEIFYKRRPELIKMVEDLHKSHRLLAEKYNQLKSQSILAIPKPFSPLGSYKQMQQIRNCYTGNSGDSEPEASIPHPQPVVENPDFEAETSNFDLGSLGVADEFMKDNMSKNSKMKHSTSWNFNERGMENKIDGVEHDGITNRNFRMPDLERKKMWHELQLDVTKLIEDNLVQQAELIRRNDEKREAIKVLLSQINRLMDENRALRSSQASHRLSR